MGRDEAFFVKKCRVPTAGTIGCIGSIDMGTSLGKQTTRFITAFIDERSSTLHAVFIIFVADMLTTHACDWFLFFISQLYHLFTGYEGA